MLELLALMIVFCIGYIVRGVPEYRTTIYPEARQCDHPFKASMNAKPINQPRQADYPLKYAARLPDDKIKNEV